MGRTNTKDLLFSLFLLSVCILFYQQAGDIKNVTGGIIIWDVGPAFFPKIVSVIGSILAIVYFFQSLFFGADTADSKEKEVEKTSGLKLQVGTLVLLLLYIYTLPRIGYVQATVPFVFLGMFFLGPKSFKNCATYLVFSVITTFSLWYLFGQLLKLFLP